MSFCKVERSDGLLIVTLNAPDRLNALAPDCHHEMAQIFDDYESDPTLHVAILTGAGRAFCAGADIKAMDAGVETVLPPSGGGGITYRRMGKPLIGAANGLALGGGFEILLSCDVIIADESAVFGLPEPRVGAAAMGGGIAHLARKIPYALAMGLILTGDRISAQDAFRYGLVNEVAPAGAALDVARAWAARMLECAPAALQASKRIAALALDGLDAKAVEAAEAIARAEVMSSQDRHEGMRAFLERRPPVWTGA